MHDRFVLLRRERDLTDKDSLLLSGWLKNYDELGVAYRLKEDFFGIYDAQSPDEAQGRYLEWKSRITPEVAPAFSDLVRAWDNWTPWILGYFDHPVTNAYTESLNSLIRVMDRLGRGYSFEALRAKILFSEGAHKHKNSRPKFERKTKERIEPELEYSRSFEMFSPSFGGMERKLPKPRPAPSTQLEKNYGASISTLIELLEAGEL